MLGLFFKKTTNIIHKFFLEDCLYELSMLENNRIGISEEIDVNKTKKSKEYGICHYWYVLDKSFKYTISLQWLS